MKRFLNVLGSIIGAIILGAIGSGVWEKFLSPALAAVSTWTVNTLSAFSASYRDSIYARAARDITDLYAMKVAFLIFIIAGLLILVPILAGFFERIDLSAERRGRLRAFARMNSVALGMALVAMGFFSLVKVSAAAQIKESALRSLEIARPAMGDVEYVRLRAAFYSVRTKGDFDAFRASVLKYGTPDNRLPLAEMEE